MLNPHISFFENSMDQDQLASLFSIALVMHDKNVPLQVNLIKKLGWGSVVHKVFGMIRVKEIDSIWM